MFAGGWLGALKKKDDDNHKIQLNINLHSLIEWAADMKVANAWVIQT